MAPFRSFPGRGTLRRTMVAIPSSAQNTKKARPALRRANVSDERGELEAATNELLGAKSPYPMAGKKASQSTNSSAALKPREARTREDDIADCEMEARVSPYRTKHDERTHSRELRRTSSLPREAHVN